MDKITKIFENVVRCKYKYKPSMKTLYKQHTLSICIISLGMLATIFNFKHHVKLN